MTELTKTRIESSDDELPEEVDFGASKSAALKSVKDGLEAAKREKTLLKEKRKKRQQLFQEQKKRKLLPQDVLEEFDVNPQKQPDPLDNEVVNKKVSTKLSGNKKGKTKTFERTSKSLPDSYSVTRIKDESAAKSLQQKAMEFIHTRLYGPETHRTTNSEILSLKKKRDVSLGPAVEFIKKTSGEK